MSGGANGDEGADPSADIKKQNPGGTTVEDLTEGGGDTKTQDLAKAGREDMDPDAGAE